MTDRKFTPPTEFPAENDPPVGAGGVGVRLDRPLRVKRRRKCRRARAMMVSVMSVFYLGTHRYHHVRSRLASLICGVYYLIFGPNRQVRPRALTAPY